MIQPHGVYSPPRITIAKKHYFILSKNPRIEEPAADPLSCAIKSEHVSNSEFARSIISVIYAEKSLQAAYDADNETFDAVASIPSDSLSFETNLLKSFKKSPFIIGNLLIVVPDSKGGLATVRSSQNIDKYVLHHNLILT